MRWPFPESALEWGGASTLLDLVSLGPRRRLLGEVATRLRSVREVPIYYDPAYRLPLASIEAAKGVEPRRADFVVWYLLWGKVVKPAHLRAPRRAIYADLARVHTPEYLESIGRPETLASFFAVDPSDVPVDETLNSVRLATGGTLDAAREALRSKGPTVNLLGGFHHASPDHGAGMCPVNDMAIALAVLRSEGFDGKVAVIDLDAHPPDGTARCLAGDDKVWIGSLSGTDWTPPHNVDETILPEGCTDARYLRALDAMLSRMPRSDLAFVIAGGDVLANDRFGRLALTLDGVRRRDIWVAEALEGTPSVWLPGGGYHRDAWKIPAGTVLVLTGRPNKVIPARFDPMRARYSRLFSESPRERLSGMADFSISAEDVEGSLHLKGAEQRLLLGYYTAEAVEYALHHCGMLGHIQRLGYGQFRVEIDDASPGDRVRLFGTSEGVEHVLVECVLEKRRVADADVLYIHWMTLRNPRARFSPGRPQLPGQEVPGLGLARESGELLSRMARRLSLQAVVYRPAWFHMAYTARYHFRYVDPRRQGRFEAILRDLGKVPLRELTLAFAQGRVRMNGAPYAWEPDEMALWLSKNHKEDRRAAEAEKARVSFSLVPVKPIIAAPSMNGP